MVDSRVILSNCYKIHEGGYLTIIERKQNKTKKFKTRTPFLLKQNRTDLSRKKTNRKFPSVDHKHLDDPLPLKMLCTNFTSRFIILKVKGPLNICVFFDKSSLVFK